MLGKNGNSHVNEGDGVPGNGVPSLFDGTPPGLLEDQDVSEGGVPGLLGGIPPGLMNVADEIVQEGDSIQAAVDAAEEDDMILVAGGDYAESVDIATNGIHLKGLEGEDLPTITNYHEQDGEDSPGGGDSMVYVSSEDVTVEGMQIETYPSDGAKPSALTLDGDEGKAIGNTVTHGEDLSGHPLIGGEGEDAVIEDNMVENGAIGWWGAGDVEINGNEFEGQATDEAIWLSEGVDDLVIEDNDFSDFDAGDDAADIKIMEEPESLNGESDFDNMEEVANDLLEAQEDAESVELWDGEIYVLGVASEDGVDAAVDSVG